jgi:hypothetical protein
MPASPARGVACSVEELMRRDGRFAWRPLRVRAVRGTGVSSSSLNFMAGSGEVLNGSCLGLYIPGRETGCGSLLCCSPPALVSATQGNSQRKKTTYLVRSATTPFVWRWPTG